MGNKIPQDSYSEPRSNEEVKQLKIPKQGKISYLYLGSWRGIKFLRKITFSNENSLQDMKTIKFIKQIYRIAGENYIKSLKWCSRLKNTFHCIKVQTTESANMIFSKYVRDLTIQNFQSVSSREIKSLRNLQFLNILDEEFYNIKLLTRLKQVTFIKFDRSINNQEMLQELKALAQSKELLLKILLTQDSHSQIGQLSKNIKSLQLKNFKKSVKTQINPKDLVHLQSLCVLFTIKDILGLNELIQIKTLKYLELGIYGHHQEFNQVLGTPLPSALEVFIFRSCYLSFLQHQSLIDCPLFTSLAQLQRIKKFNFHTWCIDGEIKLSKDFSQRLLQLCSKIQSVNLNLANLPLRSTNFSNLKGSSIEFLTINLGTFEFVSTEFWSTLEHLKGLRMEIFGSNERSVKDFIKALSKIKTLELFFLKLSVILQCEKLALIKLLLENQNIRILWWENLIENDMELGTLGSSYGEKLQYLKYHDLSSSFILNKLGLVSDKDVLYFP